MTPECEVYGHGYDDRLSTIVVEGHGHADATHPALVVAMARAELQRRENP